MHPFSKYDSHTVEIINQFNEDMRIVQHWINENPEYLLVVMSDHGGAWPDDDILRYALLTINQLRTNFLTALTGHRTAATRPS